MTTSAQAAARRDAPRPSPGVLAARLVLFVPLVGTVWWPAQRVTGWRAGLAWVLVAAFGAIFVVGNRRWADARAPRRYGPAAVVALAALDVALSAVLGFPVELAWLPFVVVLLAGRSLAPAAAAAVVAAPLACLAVAVHRTETGLPLATVGNVLAAVIMLGVVLLRRRQREAEELAEAQAEVIRTQRERAAAAAAQRELGAHLHDVLAHSLSGLVVTLTTASLQARSEGASPELVDRLEAAAELARGGLVEARRAVDALRGSDDEPGAGPVAGSRPGPGGPAGARGTETGASRGAAVASTEGDEALPAWFARTLSVWERGADARVTVLGDLADVPDAWAPLARSVLTESLTNSLKHSPGADVQVRVGPRGLSVLSLAPRPAGADPRDHPSGRHGLAGLRARVEAAGGRLEAGPDEQGWRVRWEWASGVGR